MGFVEQRRNFNDGNPPVDHFRNNFPEHNNSRGGGDGGMNRSAMDGRKEHGNREMGDARGDRKFGRRKWDIWRLVA